MVLFKSQLGLLKQVDYEFLKSMTPFILSLIAFFRSLDSKYLGCLGIIYDNIYRQPSIGIKKYLCQCHNCFPGIDYTLKTFIEWNEWVQLFSQTH